MNTEITAEVESFVKQQVAITDRVNVIEVTSDASAEAANDLLKLMRSASNVLEDKRKELTGPLLESKRRIDGFFNQQIERLDLGVKQLKAKIGGYLESKRKAEEEAVAKRRAEEEAVRRKLEDEARKREAEAAAARAKAEAEAEEARRRAQLAEEARRKAEAEGNAKAAAQAAAEAAKLNQQAQAKLESGEAKAAAIETQAAATREAAAGITSSGPAAVAGPKGFSQRSVYGYEIVDFMALVKAVAAGEQPATFLQVNETVLRQYAQAVKTGFKVPGCRLTERKV